MVWGRTGSDPFWPRVIAPFSAQIVQRSAAVNAKKDAKGLGQAGLGPEVDPAVGRVAVDLAKLLGREAELLEGGDILFQLRHAAGADQRGGAAGIAQRPGPGQLRQRLAAPLCPLAQRP